MREQRGGRPVMGGPLLSKGGESVGDVGGAGSWVLCPAGGAGGWFGGDPGGSGSDPKDFGVGCGVGEGREAGGATASPRG